MKYIDTSQLVDIPEHIAVCPECHGGLWVEVSEYTPEDGEITEGGFEVHCNNEGDDLHDWLYPSDWHPIENKIYKWLLDNVRVAEATESDLTAWNEAVKDWAMA